MQKSVVVNNFEQEIKQNPDRQAAFFGSNEAGGDNRRANDFNRISQEMRSLRNKANLVSPR